MIRSLPLLMLACAADPADPVIDFEPVPVASTPVAPGVVDATFTVPPAVTPPTVPLDEPLPRSVMIVQDVTGSFADALDEARDADVAFLEELVSWPLPGDQVGMSTFVGGVEPTPWTPLTEIAGNEQALLDQWNTLAPCNCTAPYSWSACVNSGAGWNAQPWMINCYTYGSNTAQGPAMWQAADELIAKGTPDAYLAMVLVSDGLPCCGDETLPRSQDAVAAADYAWANGIHVWSVGFSHGGASLGFLETLIRGDGAASLTSDPDELVDVMLDIADQIRTYTDPDATP